MLTSEAFGLLVCACSNGHHAYDVAQDRKSREKYSKLLVAGQQVPDRLSKSVNI